jgi:hypothetical protein
MNERIRNKLDSNHTSQSNQPTLPVIRMQASNGITVERRLFKQSPNYQIRLLILLWHPMAFYDNKDYLISRLIILNGYSDGFRLVFKLHNFALVVWRRET